MNEAKEGRRRLWEERQNAWEIQSVYTAQSGEIPPSQNRPIPRKWLIASWYLIVFALLLLAIIMVVSTASGSNFISLSGTKFIVHNQSKSSLCGITLIERGPSINLIAETGTVNGSEVIFIYPENRGADEIPVSATVPGKPKLVIYYPKDAAPIDTLYPERETWIDGTTFIGFEHKYNPDITWVNAGTTLPDGTKLIIKYPGTAEDVPLAINKDGLLPGHKAVFRLDPGMYEARFTGCSTAMYRHYVEPFRFEIEHGQTVTLTIEDK